MNYPQYLNVGDTALETARRHGARWSIKCQMHGTQPIYWGRFGSETVGQCIICTSRGLPRFRRASKITDGG